MSSETKNIPTAEAEPTDWLDRLYRRTPEHLFRKVTIGAIAVSGLLNIAPGVGPSRDSAPNTPDTSATTPVTLESTSELENTREEAQAVATSLADQIMDQYDEAPDEMRELDEYSANGAVTYTVSMDVPPNESGEGITGGMSAQVGLDQNGQPDPRLARQVSVFVNRATYGPLAEQETLFSFELDSVMPDGLNTDVTEWTMREVAESPDGHITDSTFGTMPPKMASTDGILDLPRLQLAADRATEVIGRT